MRKKNISKILTTGSAKQRAFLIFENIASSKFRRKPLLTEEEYIALYDSFKTDREIDIFNKFLTIDEQVTQALLLLQGAVNNIKTNY